MKSSLRRLPLVGALVGALLLAACSTDPSDSGGESEGAPAQSVTIAANDELASLDPFGQYAASLDMALVARQIYDTLIVPDDEGGYVPHIATEWTASDDGRSWTFTLRDVQFSDGTPLTSADVSASIEAVVAGGGPLAGVWEPIEVETPDDRTVVLTSPNAGAGLLSRLPELRILPADRIGEQGFFTEPVGLGPFMVESFTANQQAVLVRNPNYWGEPAKLDELTIRAITDVSAQVTSVMNDEIQAVWGIPDDQFAQLESVENLSTAIEPAYTNYVLWMNAQRPGLDTLEVRQALWMAVDFEAIREALLPSTAIPSEGPVSQALAGAGSFDGYEYNPERARELLAEAGYDGNLTVGIQYGTSETFQLLAEAIQSYLAEVGVTVELQPKESSAYLEDLLALNFDINLQTMGPKTSDPSTDLARLYPCEAQRTGFCNDELDALIEAGNATVDPEERVQAFLDVQEMIWDNAVGMYPMDVAITYAWSNSLSGFTPDPGAAPDMSVVEVVSNE